MFNTLEHLWIQKFGADVFANGPWVCTRDAARRRIHSPVPAHFAVLMRAPSRVKGVPSVFVGVELARDHRGSDDPQFQRFTLKGNLSRIYCPGRGEWVVSSIAVDNETAYALGFILLQLRAMAHDRTGNYHQGGPSRNGASHRIAG